MFFLMGSPESGVDLLADLLDRHGSIAISTKPEFVEQLCRSVIEKDLEGVPSSAAGLIGAASARWAQQAGKPVAGVAGPHLIAQLRLLREANALDGHQVIHIVRDVRDIVASTPESAWSSSRGAADFALSWNRENTALHQAFVSPSDQYHLVRYEDLVTSTEACLQGIVSFLGLPYEPVTSPTLGAHSQRDSVPRGPGNPDVAKLGESALKRFGYHPDSKPAKSAHGATSPVIVLGMHRSGTSAVAGALTLHGFDIGRSPMPAREDNPKGFFENVQVVEFNDWYLHQYVSASWYDAPVELTLPINETVKARFRELWFKEFDPEKPILIKDPRLCLLLPLWQTLLKMVGATPRYVFVIRHPLDVAESLHRRSRMPLERGGFLWAQHLLLAERNSRDAARFFVSYDNLMQNVEAENDRLLDWFQSVGQKYSKPDRKELNAFYARENWHRRQVEELRVFPDFVGPLFQLAESLAGAGNAGLAGDESAQQWDQFARPLEQWFATFPPLSEELIADKKRAAALFEENAGLKDLAASRDERIAVLSQWGTSLHKEVGLIKAWGQSLERDVAEARALVAQKNEEIEVLSRWGQGLDAELNALRAASEEGQREGKWRQYSSAEYTELQQVLEAKENELVRIKEWGVSLEAELATAREVALSRQGEIETLSSWGQSLDQELKKALQLVEVERELRAAAKEWAVGLEADVAAARQVAESRQAEIETLSSWGQSLDQELKKALQLVEVERELRAALETKDNELRAVKEWAVSLEADVAAAREVALARQGQIEALSSWGHSLDQELNEARQMLDRRDAELARIRGSLPWRVYRFFFRKKV